MKERGDSMMEIDDIILRLLATVLLLYDALMFYWRFKGEEK